MVEQSPGTFQTTTREVQTAIPRDPEMSIRRMDWRRLYRRVRGIPRPTSLYTSLSAVCWGVGTSALLSLVPLYQAAEQVDAWVRPTYWVVGIGACLLGWLAHKFDKDRGTYIE